MTRQILAEFDDTGVRVYQAFSPEIVAAALSCRTFDEGFELARFTWIKPSFGWMLYRSGYASKPGQERILKITVRHEGFREILAAAVPSSWKRRLFASETQWRAALRESEVRYQWDPDRD